MNEHGTNTERTRNEHGTEIVRQWYGGGIEEVRRRYEREADFWVWFLVFKIVTFTMRSAGLLHSSGLTLPTGRQERVIANPLQTIKGS
jgi:hypothetical protein